MSDSHSVTGWIAEFREGDEDAAQMIWSRFRGRVEAMASKRLGKVPPKLGDAEDLTQVVFAAVFDGVKNDRFRKLESREDLWQILALVTARRAANLYRKSASMKETGESALVMPGYLSPGRKLAHDCYQAMQSISDEGLTDSIQFASKELLGGLEPQLREVALLRFKGYSNNEVAKQIGKSVKTVERYLKMIRHYWEQPT